MSPDEVVIYETEVETERGKVSVRLCVSASTLEVVAARGIGAHGDVTFRAEPIKED